MRLLCRIIGHKWYRGQVTWTCTRVGCYTSKTAPSYAKERDDASS